MDLSDYRKFRATFLEMTDRASRLARDLEFSGLVAMTDRLRERILEERFFVSVLGEIKRGKSTLINALVGSEILPKAALVCTAALCIIRYGNPPVALVHRRDGTSGPVDPTALKEVVTKKNSKASEIAFVEIGLPLPLLEEGVVIVDTPGVNDTDELRRRITEEFIPRSDGVLFVLNAGQPLSDSEAVFLTNGILKYHVKKFWFVVNGMDRLENDVQRRETLDYCSEHLSQLLPAPRIFGVSARQALEGRKSGRSDLEDRSGVPAFLEVFSRDLVEGRREFLFDVPLGTLGTILADIERGIGLSREMVSTDEARVSAATSALRAEAEKVLAEKDRILERFSAQVESALFEVLAGIPIPDPPEVPSAIGRILDLDQPDEGKIREIAHLLSGQIQAFSTLVQDRLSARVRTAAGAALSSLSDSVGKLDSRAGILPPGTAITIPDLGLDMRPPSGELEKAGAIGSFGRLATLAFLLHGNFLLAATSLLGAWATRLDRSSAPALAGKFREGLREAVSRMKEDVLARKTEIARTVTGTLASEAGRMTDFIGEMILRDRERTFEGKAGREKRLAHLDGVASGFKALKADFDSLRMEIGR